MKRQLIYHTHVSTNQSTKVEVDVQSESENITCYLDRVSRDGITLSCDSKTIHSILPNKTRIIPKEPVSIKAAFALEKNINALCRVIFARRLSKDQFIIELKFVDMNEQDRQHLDRYIEKVLRSQSVSHNEEHKIPQQAKPNSSKVFNINDENLKMTYSKVA